MSNKTPLKTVGIYLRGNALSPEHVSRVLGIQPSSAQTKGGRKAGSTRYIAKIGMWAIKVKSDLRSLTELIDEVFTQIGNPRIKLDCIEGVEDAHLDILFAFGEDVTDAVEFTLTKAQTQRVSQLGLSISVTVM